MTGPHLRMQGPLAVFGDGRSGGAELELLTERAVVPGSRMRAALLLCTAIHYEPSEFPKPCKGSMTENDSVALISSYVGRVEPTFLAHASLRCAPPLKKFSDCFSAKAPDWHPVGNEKSGRQCVVRKQQLYRGVNKRRGAAAAPLAFAGDPGRGALPHQQELALVRDRSRARRGRHGTA